MISSMQNSKKVTALNKMDILKTKYLLLILFCIPLSSDAQVLFTYGNNSVNQDEFKEAFHQRAAQNGNKKENPREYLQLFIRYKLKEQAGFDEQLDTMASFHQEVENYKLLLADKYINEAADENKYVKEARERAKTDLLIQQIFIRFGKDSTVSYQNIQKAYSLLLSGKSFDETTTALSSDEDTRKNKGIIGYITVFTLPYEIENMVYALKPGEFSKPFKSRAGYHIFKLIQQRPAAGTRKIEQILLPFQPRSSDLDRKKLAILADSLYKLAINGYSFEDLAKQYSNRNNTVSGNNLIMEISIGQYARTFEDHVFELKQPGEISLPFNTDFGYHIIKLVEKITSNRISDTIIRNQVENNDRMKFAKHQLLQQWLRESKFKRNSYDEKLVARYIDSSFRNQSLRSFTTISAATILFSFEKQNITLGEFVRYLKSNRLYNDPLKKLDDFIALQCSNYYRSHLQDYNVQVKKQVDNFIGANVLFAAMDKHIWSKALQDSLGTRNYYLQHKQNYMWEPGITALTVTSKSREKVKSTIQMLSLLNWRKVAETVGDSVFIDSNRYEKKHLPVNQSVEMKKGYATEPEPSVSQPAFIALKVLNVHTLKEQRTFEESKGMVINDYQQKLEDEWISMLKKKYPVRINQEVWKTTLDQLK